MGREVCTYTYVRPAPSSGRDLSGNNSAIRMLTGLCHCWCFGRTALGRQTALMAYDRTRPAGMRLVCATSFAHKDVKTDLPSRLRRQCGELVIRVPMVQFFSVAPSGVHGEYSHWSPGNLHVLSMS